MDADDADHMAYLESRYNTVTAHNQIMVKLTFFSLWLFLELLQFQKDVDSLFVQNESKNFKVCLFLCKTLFMNFN